jgi:type IV pilus assembly protein PilV
VGQLYAGMDRRDRLTPARGFTLIEVLVTLLLITVSLIGMAGMQLAAKRAGYQAMQRSQAMALAQEALERIRANPGQAAAYHTGLGAAALGGGKLAAPELDCAAAKAECTPAQLALWDRWQWERKLDGMAGGGGLIEPRACIVFNAAAGRPNSGQIRIILNWRGPSALSDAIQAGEELCGTDAGGSDAQRQQLVLSSYVLAPGDL